MPAHSVFLLGTALQAIEGGAAFRGEVDEHSAP